MIRGKTSRTERLPTVSTAWTTVKGLLRNPWQLVVGLKMPGRSHRGPLPPLTEEQRSLAAELRRDVEHLSLTIGERNCFVPDKYEQAQSWLGDQIRTCGLSVHLQPFDCRGYTCVNLWGEVTGRDKPEEIIVVGSHYDSLRHCPAANDNGSGVAATLALMRRFAAGDRPSRTVRFAFFANEEPPYFWTEFMGSAVMGEKCREKRERIVAMLTPETIGCYADEPGTQRYPLPLVKRFYGDRGDFIAFVGIGRSAKLVRRCTGLFRRHARFPSLGAALPSVVPGVGASDHWGFWRVGYPALMVTDTAPFRYPYYHTRLDLPDKMDFERMARVVDGLNGVVRSLADEGP
ncbi:MAG TPA: M28 family peptidase [Phycisphaerales bacterium]|nr:M28 family peptidase [Phycisphaerales bacterium]